MGQIHYVRMILRGPETVTTISEQSMKAVVEGRGGNKEEYRCAGIDRLCEVRHPLEAGRAQRT